MTKGPSTGPRNWWQQRKEFPMIGHCWTTRAAHLPNITIPSNIKNLIHNPFEDNQKTERKARHRRDGSILDEYTKQRVLNRIDRMNDSLKE